jgi:hypothetical protein
MTTLLNGVASVLLAVIEKVTTSPTTPAELLTVFDKLRSAAANPQNEVVTNNAARRLQVRPEHHKPSHVKVSVKQP